MKHAHKGRADLIVADLRLADGASGIDAIAGVRAALRADTPALIVSGDTSAGAEAEAEAARTRLLLKPVIATMLKDAAEDALREQARMSRGQAKGRRA